MSSNVSRRPRSVSGLLLLFSCIGFSLAAAGSEPADEFRGCVYMQVAASGSEDTFWGPVENYRVVFSKNFPFRNAGLTISIREGSRRVSGWYYPLTGKVRLLQFGEIAAGSDLRIWKIRIQGGGETISGSEVRLTPDKAAECAHYARLTLVPGRPLPIGIWKRGAASGKTGTNRLLYDSVRDEKSSGIFLELHVPASAYPSPQEAPPRWKVLAGELLKSLRMPGDFPVGDGDEAFWMDMVRKWDAETFLFQRGKIPLSDLLDTELEIIARLSRRPGLTAEQAAELKKQKRQRVENRIKLAQGEYDIGTISLEELQKLRKKLDEP